MLAVNVGETPEAIEAFLETVPIDFPILLGDGARTLPDWGGRALPTTLIVDARGGSCSRRSVRATGTTRR